jgi:hypothetical protein
LIAVDDAMNCTLSDALRVSMVNNLSFSPPNPDQQCLSILHVRGSTVRYIHFPPHLNLVSTIQQGWNREKAGQRKYQRTSMKATARK